MADVMKRTFLYIVSFLAIFLLGFSALAAEKVRIKLIAGEVVTIDDTVKTLTLKGRKAEVVIVADDKTIVKLDKEKKNFSDIAVGDKVTVKYAEIEGKNVARSIDIKTAKTSKKGADSPKQAEPAKPAPKVQ